MLLYYMLVKMLDVLEGLVVNKENIKKNLNITHGLIFSQRALLKLIEKGVSREDAYAVIQENALKSWNTHTDFKKLLSRDRRISGKIKAKEIEDIFDPSKGLKNVDYIFKNVGIK